MLDPRELLTRLEVAADSGALPHDVSQWLLEGIDGFKAGTDLSVALGLRPGPGVRAWRNVERVKQRNYWIRKAAGCVGGEAGTWDRAGRLAAAIRTFQARTWPRIRNHTPPPPDAPIGDLLTHFLTLAHHAHPGNVGQFPTSQRQIFRLLT